MSAVGTDSLQRTSSNSHAANTPATNLSGVDATTNTVSGSVLATQKHPSNNQKFQRTVMAVVNNLNPSAGESPYLKTAAICGLIAFTLYALSGGKLIPFH